VALHPGLFRLGSLAADLAARPFVTKLIGYDAGPRDIRRRAKAVGKWPPGHRYRYTVAE
jgi:hypothetical protein